jgi:hypothetical protein
VHTEKLVYAAGWEGLVVRSKQKLAVVEHTDLVGVHTRGLALHLADIRGWLLR